ncbi:SDR family oxidoreductase [Filimonas effusa]|uniref:SDR family oxidoreductase n=1 Tax=Filimonas effusa TaxID=2508721 RepID=A0A4V1M9X6_9BACT|nr:SDR family oxidoreductase [Filimonas effusa]RXK83204.1 SDR family oxidoreductase [Filimonas effusa]
MSKSIFITGASSGLGKAAARLFQSKGWNVIATMRQPEKETELRQLKNITILPLDVTNGQQVNDTVEQVANLYDIDVVLNNAGYGLIGPLEAFSEEQINKQVDTNLLGVIRVSKAFIPWFREKRKGLFLNITSSFGLLGFPTCTLYSATKFAVDGFSEALALELAQFDVRVKIVAPGGIRTDFAGRSLQSGTHGAYRQLMAKVAEGYSAEQVANYASAEDIARVIFEAATDGQDKLRYVAGKDAIALYHERTATGAEAQLERLKSAFLF